MYTLTLDCSFSSLSSKHLSSVYSLIIPDDIRQRRHSPCPQRPLKSGLRKKPNILHHQWHHKVVSGSNFCMGGVCVCCLNVPNGKRRFELGPKQWLQYAWPRAQHQQRHSVASGAEAGIVGWPRSFIHSFIRFSIYLTMISEGLLGTRDLCLFLRIQWGAKMHTVSVYMELSVQRAKAMACCAKLRIWIFKNGSKICVLKRHTCGHLDLTREKGEQGYYLWGWCCGLGKGWWVKLAP